ncbi:dipeptide/oligopeptide/nickel ABC transporter ATP-binding protein [Frondihabitans sucicola]|uniref:Dipeptide/oligopeptide/nickel ABC transporter ATP-binding protein n=1 Tax=Frondihabitans sucicola TaxID=1268041 RepID=A0ABM8GS73_9MICO|nr:ATP-binding cassette domain-containing protein [Frondihabitans sucicola]BDZ51334.1 dipeptide/oligopeptide/nickel ABC transporter ATP-binding protein [Frondihabitans sucicola]
MISVSGLSKSYHRVGRSPVVALDHVDLAVPDGAAVGLVGESGSGKSTLLRTLMGLESADAGTIELDGDDVTHLRGRPLAAFRRTVQMVFQDPLASLNPRMTVGDIIAEGMLVHRLQPDGRSRGRRVAELLELVGLDARHATRRPASFSGGQRQRIAIARALAVEPRVLVCDEPVSALDVSVQAQVLNLLGDMRQELGLSLLFVAHDLAVVRYLCPDVYVLRSGVIVEHASREEIFTDPQHGYTQKLVAAVPENEALRPAHDYVLPPQKTLEV